MNTYTLIPFLALCAIIGLILAGFSRYIVRKEQEHFAFMAGLLERHAAERRDLVDRLMSRDLTEVKQAQAIQSVTPRVVSKSQNNAKIAEETRKVEAGLY